MADNGIVLLGHDEAIEARAARAKLGCVIDPDYGLHFAKQLTAPPGGFIPWDLLPAAWHFLNRWDSAIPLWRYGVLAKDVGSEADRKRTAKVTRDLRVLLFAHELWFLQQSEGGLAFHAAFLEERSAGGDLRLAMLRAFYRVKPMVCVLPRTWFGSVGAARRLTGRQERRRQRSAAPAGSPGEAPRVIEIEIAPGVRVKCLPDDEEKVRAKYERLRSGRGAQRRRGG